MLINSNAMKYALILCFALASPLANAAMIYVGTFSGNDGINADGSAQLSDYIDPTVYQLDRVDWDDNVDTFTPSQTSGDLTITGTVFKDDEPAEAIAGTWEYTGDGSLNYLTMKFDGFFVLWEITDGTTSGNWDARDWSSDPTYALSHGAGYTVPVPAAVWLFASGLVGLVAVSRRKKTV